jgi:hypothetical protein
VITVAPIVAAIAYDPYDVSNALREGADAEGEL